MMMFDQLKKKLSSRWARGVFLRAELAGENLFPLRQPVKGPTSVELSERFDETRAWVKSLKLDCEKAGIEIEWKEINHRQIGRNRIPSYIVFNHIEQLALLLGKKRELDRCREDFTLLTAAFPELKDWAEARPFILVKHHDSMQRLILVLKWMKQNPQPGIYIRQLSLPGIDTKFIEAHRGILATWLDIILEPESIKKEFTGFSGFEQRYGFLYRPEIVRFRIFAAAAGFSDMSVTAAEFATWNPEISRVFVVENDVTALAFPKVPDSIVLFGRGYHFGNLAGAKWMREKEIYYWGDIDTHGFGILNQFRDLFPAAESFLMDRSTLLSHEAHWGVEPKQLSSGSLTNLTDEEAAVFAELKSGSIGSQIRLEQEFVDYSMVTDFIRSF